MRGWVQRTRTLHGELAAVADIPAWWWLLAAGVAVAERAPARRGFVSSGATPATDTFLAWRGGLGDPIARARAARDAIRALDGTLPAQPLAVTVAGTDLTATLTPSLLDVAAFAFGHTVVVSELDDPALPLRLARALAGHADGRPWTGRAPFVCVSIGDDPIDVARHGHRRAWTASGGPWLGIGTSGDLVTVSTCHMVVDGHGHVLLAQRIAATPVPVSASDPVPTGLPPVAGSVPLGVAWRELPDRGPRLLELAYRLGCILHERTSPTAVHSPTVQIPIAPGERDDPQRLVRRVVPAATSVRFADNGQPEPFEEFAARTRASLAREANGAGLLSRLLAAMRALPTPLAWKRRAIAAGRPAWIDRFADVLGGRACLSRMQAPGVMPPLCAVSAPPKHASPDDPTGSCVVTIIADGSRAAITVCGHGLAGSPAEAEALLDELLR